MYLFVHMTYMRMYVTYACGSQSITCSRQLFPSTMFVSILAANTFTHSIVSLYVFPKLKFLTKQYMVACAYNPSTCDVEKRESGIWGYPQLHREFGESLSYMRLCFIKNKTKS